MPAPSPEGRTLLDDSVQRLALLALEKNLDLSIEKFKPKNVAEAERAKWRIRHWLILWTGVLVFIIINVLILAAFSVYLKSGSITPRNVVEIDNIPNTLPSVLLLSTLWFTAMGGLGAVTNLFSVYLQLRPTEGLSESDIFVVNARIILGCIGSLVVSLTVLAPYASQFFKDVLAFQIPTGGWRLLIPFIIGFAFPLALALLQRLIRTVEFFLGIDLSNDRSERSATRQRR